MAYTCAQTHAQERISLYSLTVVTQPVHTRIKITIGTGQSISSDALSPSEVTGLEINIHT